MKKTRIICGRKIVLEKGKRYLATRPIGRIHGEVVITIYQENKGQDVYPGKMPEVLKLHGFTYEEANEFLERFNNEQCSFSGRVW